MADGTRGTVALPVTWLEVFADQPLGGNLHVVVHDADVLAEETLAAFARRTRLSETSYLQRATDPGADYRHRIFTIMTEIPFAGHPSLGAAVAFALSRGEHAASLVQETGAGLQALRVEIDRSSTAATAEITQNTPEHLGEISPEPVLVALGLSTGTSHDDLPCAVVSTGLPTLIVPVTDVAALARAEPDLVALSAVLAGVPGSPVTCYVVAEEGGGRWRARCFTDQVAGGEDAATGSAAGPLTAYAHRYRGLTTTEIDQGLELGSPSRLSGRIEEDRVVVGGTVRIISHGSIELPAHG